VSRKGTSAEFGISPIASVERQLGARMDKHADGRWVKGFGERRHLTVLFCDLVNSTGLAAHLDPEEWRDIVVNYHLIVTQEIGRFGGHVAQYLGDGVIAYFGWPEAQGDDVRACCARRPRDARSNIEIQHGPLALKVGRTSGD
jgi:class 3 adenylate cyclase